ncbi:MAG: hypothetical protein ACRC6M_05175, partial [Microcystaceae cyanobacterium]
MQLLADPTLDPLIQSQLSADELLALTDDNETAAAKQSLDATLRHWQDGRAILAADWVQELYTTVFPIAKQQGFGCFLLPIQQILRSGNTAQQWLRQLEQGWTLPAILQGAIAELEQEESVLEDYLCQAWGHSYREPSEMLQRS